MTDFGESGHTDEALRYGRHTLFRDEAIPVLRLLEQAVIEGRPLKLNWPGQNETGRVHDEPEAATMVMPRVPGEQPLGELSLNDSPADFTGSDDNTEPNASRREALRWLGPEGFTWFPRALAG